MPKQKGIIKLEGTIGDITYYQMNNNYYLRSKSTLKKDRVINDPSFQRTMENSREFASVLGTVKLVRTALLSMHMHASDRSASSKLISTFIAVKNMDTQNVRGSRCVESGIQTDIGKQRLTGFNFNAPASLANVLAKPYTLDTESRVWSLQGFCTGRDVAASASATHVVFAYGIAAIDPIHGKTETGKATTDYLAIGPAETDIMLTPTLNPSALSGFHIHVLMVSYYQEINGVYYALHNSALHPLEIIGVH